MVSENDPNIDYYAGKDIEPGKPTKYYHVQAKRMQEEEKTTMYIDYEHLCQFNPDEKDEDLPEDILANYYRFEAGLHRALHTFMARNFADYANSKTFFLAFYNLPTCLKLRELKTGMIGRMQSIYGTVTRTTEVRPELIKGGFKCMDTGRIYRDVEQQFKLTYPNLGNTSTSKFELVPEESVFTDWQKLRVQEHSGDIPAGPMPRSIEIILSA